MRSLYDTSGREVFIGRENVQTPPYLVSVYHQTTEWTSDRQIAWRQTLNAFGLDQWKSDD